MAAYASATPSAQVKGELIFGPNEDMKEIEVHHFLQSFWSSWVGVCHSWKGGFLIFLLPP